MAHTVISSNADLLTYEDIRSVHETMGARHTQSIASPPSHIDPYGRKNSYEDKLAILDKRSYSQKSRITQLENQLFDMQAKIDVLRIDTRILLEKLYKYNAIPKG